MSTNMLGTVASWNGVTLPTAEEADIANWNEIDFTIDSTDVLQALYESGSWGGNTAPSNRAGLLWIDFDAWVQSCDAVSCDGCECNSADYTSYSDGKAYGVAWDDGGNDIESSNKEYFVVCFKLPNFCEGI